MIIDMFLELFFSRLSLAKQADIMKRRGVVIGTRNKNGRLGYLYMLNNLFAEVFYENDNPLLAVENVVVLNGLKNLNRYLESELR